MGGGGWGNDGERFPAVTSCCLCPLRGACLSSLQVKKDFFGVQSDGLAIVCFIEFVLV